MARILENGHEDLRALCRDLPGLLPGFTLGTVVFRLAADGNWALSELRGGLDPRPFLRPDIGTPCDLAQKQAASVLANPRRFDLALSPEFLRQAAI